VVSLQPSNDRLGMGFPLGPQPPPRQLGQRLCIRLALEQPLRRFFVAQRTGSLTVNTERMMPAVLAIVQWCNANGYKVNGW
jgi:hypothetical protein